MKNTIRFWGGQEPATEVLRLSRDGIWANPDIAVDDAATLVLAAIDSNIKVLVQKAIEAEREACARLCDDLDDDIPDGLAGWQFAEAIRARGEK